MPEPTVPGMIPRKRPKSEPTTPGMVKELHLSSCVFQREKGAPREAGVLVNNGKVIMDLDGNLVPAPIWKYYETFRHAMTINDAVD